MALTSFFTALTGLNSSSHSINVIGDNLANLNTIGFKAGKATFAELIGGMSGFSSTGNPIVFGQGSALNGLVHKQAAGTPEYTGNSTDAMINGNGFFIVATGDGGMGYTRAGRFQFDGTGNLVSSDGYQLMGYMADVDGIIDQARGVTQIEIRKGQFIPAVKTTNVSTAVNLDSRSGQNNVFATPVVVYDSLGNAHALKLSFEKTSPDGVLPEWELTASIIKDDGSEEPVVITPPAGGTTTLGFDAFGKLSAPASGSFTLTIANASLGTGVGDMDVTLNLWDERNSPLFTSAASVSGTSYVKQDGSAASTLNDVSFDNEGRVIGETADGQSIVLAQLALATFPNNEGMQKLNGSTFTAAANAGEPSIGIAGSGGRGFVQGGSLEMSNVDMAEEFVNLIIAQRAYQANTRIISTSDELYMEAINLKR